MVIDISQRKRAQLNLAEKRDALEKHVNERTAELSEANTLLQQEISERKQAEKALRESEEKYRLVVENASQGIIIVQDGLLRFVNPSAVKILGHSENVLISKPFVDFVEPNDRDLVTDGYQKIFRGEETPRSYYFRFITEDWTVKWLEVAGVLIVWEGRPSILAFLNDITERKLAEEALRESEKKYSRVVETSLTGIFMVQNDRIVFANNRFAEIFGYAKEELVGEGSVKIVHPDDRAFLEELAGERLSGKKAREEYDIRGLKKDGTIIWTRRRVTITQYRGSRAILGNVVDISRTKQMEATLRKSEENLRTLSSQLLIAQEEERKRVALELHDGIGQSLSAIKYRVETALQEMEGEKSQEGFGLLAPIVPMVRGAVEEVRRIQKDLRPSILDDLGILATLSWFCREFETIYPTIHIEKQIDINENDVPDPLKIVIYRISQEALNNIAKHSHAKRARISLECSDRMIVLSIDDDGVGFDVEKARSEAASTGGLGLSGMRERTQFSGGTFRIESHKGAGTAVQASWPFREQSPQ
jgi:PAS domain S-box-containing protein